MQNAKGGKLYVQDVIAQNADEIFRRLDSGASIYFCGLKGTLEFNSFFLALFLCERLALIYMTLSMTLSPKIVLYETGMMPPILETMEQVANDRGVNWKEMLSRLKDNHQWHVEVRLYRFVVFPFRTRNVYHLTM